MSQEAGSISSHTINEVVEGLQRKQKRIPSKYFYDQRGSELFEKITHLDEYYPTRTERKILENNIDDISAAIGSDSVLVELGSGSSSKTRLLLDHLSQLAAYVPVDISRKYLMETVRTLRKEYPELTIKPVCADYTRPFHIPELPVSFEYYVLFYPGSTIGNFKPEQARNFLGTISNLLIPGGGLLIGVDLKKDRKILEAAYNDKEGITAAFNKNMLVRLNREARADFDVDRFKHKAFYNEEKGRIEMHLVSQCEQTVPIDGTEIHFDRGETIHTENSYKYSPEEFSELVSPWYEVKWVWTDDKRLFSLQYLVKK